MFLTQICGIYSSAVVQSPVVVGGTDLILPEIGIQAAVRVGEIEYCPDMVFLGELIREFGSEAAVGRMLASVQSIHPDFS
jgi:hypothetical protein